MEKLYAIGNNSKSIENQGREKIVTLFMTQIKKLSRSSTMYTWLQKEKWDLDKNRLSVYHSFREPFHPFTKAEEAKMNKQVNPSSRQTKIKQEGNPAQPSKPPKEVDLTDDTDPQTSKYYLT
jgi:hypothetical protein